MMIRNEDIDPESHNQVSSNDPRTICFTPGGAQSDDIHPSGRTSSDDMWERSTGNKAHSGPCINRMEILGTCKAVTTRKLEFKPGRKPKEAIEGDMVRFLHNDYVKGSVSWLQGRLISRIDKLEDAVESE